jgi:tetratricopeptide (TPR) repeat protein
MTAIRAGCLLLVLAMCMALPSCAAPDRADRLVDDGRLTPEELLLRRAGREQNARDLQPMDVPIPPGIEPDALLARSPADAIAFLSLSKAIERITAEHHRQISQDAADRTDDGEEVPAAPDAPRDDEAASAALRHYVRGRQAMLDDRFYVAIAELQKAAQMDPREVRIRRELARAYLAMNNQSRAMEQFFILREIDPGDDEATFSLGLHAANRREFTAAIAILGERLLNLEPFHHDPAADLLARYTIAFALRQLGYDRAFVELWSRTDRPFENVGELFDRTMYAARLGSVYRQRSELWRSVGDARCRLGEYARALDAYAMAATLPSPDPDALHPRVIYANLRLGRVNTAQYELLSAIKNDEAISERDVRLCSYLAEHVARLSQPDADPESIALLARHVSEMYRQSPHDPALARASAALLPAADARRLLRDFVDRRPRDLDVAGSLLAWLGARDLLAAAELTADLAAAYPDLARQYVTRLIFFVPNPAELLELTRTEADRSMLRGRNSDKAMAELHIHVLAALGAPGEAWQIAEQCRTIWPNDQTIALLRIGLAVSLEEPLLLDDVLADADPFDDAWSWIVRTRALREFARLDDAIEAAERAIERSESSDTDATVRMTALVELARTYAEYADSRQDERSRMRWAEEAITVAERGLSIIEEDRHADGHHHADLTDAFFEVILTLHGPNGILRDPQSFHAAGRRLYRLSPNSRLHSRIAGEEAVSQGRFDVALERAMNLYDNRPYDIDALDLAMLAWSRMSATADRGSGLEQAREWLSDRLRDRPADPALLERWVAVCVSLDRTADAERPLTELLDHYPRYVSAALLLETIYRATGRIEEAFALGRRRLEQRPPGIRREVEMAALFGGVGRETEAIDRLAWLAEQLDRDSATRADLLPGLHQHLLAAIAILGRIEPRDARHDQITLTLVKHVASGPAERVPLQVYATGFRSLARLGRLDDPLFNELAVTAARQAGRTSESFEHLVQWLHMAQALIDDGHPAAAAEALRSRVLADVPTHPDAFNVFANATIVADAATRGGREQAGRSLAFLMRLADRNILPQIWGVDSPPTLPAVLFQTSTTYSIIGDDLGSKRILEELIGIEPDNSMALNNLGYLRIIAGHDDRQTARWIELAHELDPEDSHILDTIGWLRYLQGRFDDDGEKRGALNLIRQSAHRASEPSAEVYVHLGDTYWRLGRHEEAVEAWQTARSILEDPVRRRQYMEFYEAVQTRAWGLTVDEPQAMYERAYGSTLKKIIRKLEAVERGEPPPIAPTFAEMKK